MTARRALPTLLAAVIACGARGAPANDAPPAVSEPSSPFAITLDVRADDPVRVRAVLHNRAASSQTYLHDAMLQPSELRLFDSAGQAVEPEDERALRKYDTSVPREKYLRLAPGDSAVLGDVTAARGAGGAYALTWGPFSYDALPPGHYAAQVRWESRQREWTDPGGSRRGTLPDVWLGTVESNRVELTLP